MKERSLLDLPCLLDLVEDGQTRCVLNLPDLDLKSSRNRTMIANGGLVSFVCERKESKNVSVDVDARTKEEKGRTVKRLDVIGNPRSEENSVAPEEKEREETEEGIRTATAKRSWTRKDSHQAGTLFFSLES